ncbi:MAG: flagellar transcriptional regulator FlhD [Methylophilaceae bacterium]|uniref:flagellar transcriptional regulator FlhD n=1 Tax=Methylovorus sp. MM2 TaxID=1848038 RepID=UPI0007DEC047|nr:flagellar transcriptional regulator FlhD [Methylovorus sp. MM2]OAM51289.1 flagellar transcriptional regulator FlhD [Methylovorus sp. MM2]
MTENEIMSDIKDANLSYLMLAQQMIRADKASAIFRLGLSKDIADLLEHLSNAQLLKLSSSNMMLARFRFEDSAILGMLTSYTKERSLANAHAAILMAGQSAAVA